MLRYIVNRILWTIPVLLVATLFTFMLVHAQPGDPFARSPQVINNKSIHDNMVKKFGVDKPLAVQYLLYIKNVSHGDFGPSFYQLDTTVGEIIGRTFPTSLLLATLAILVAMSLGTLIGVLSAIRHNTIQDYGLTIASTMVFALPSFMVGTYWLVYLPEYSGWHSWQQKIGPVLVLGLGIMPYFVRLVRGSMLEALQSEYVLTARAKGLRRRTTVLRHVLRNSLIPVVTNAGPLYGYTMTGAFITEFIFNVHGIAHEFTASILEKDYNLVLGVTVLLAVIIVLLNLIVDLLLPLIDPRIVNE
jgi:oligopeptide transport system permease protein